MPAVAQMARALAAHVRDPDPGDCTAALVRDGFGPERWFECLVVEGDNGLAGFSLVCRRYEAHTGQRRLWIGDLYVVPEARRHGAAQILLQALAKRARELGCTHLSWELWRENEAARGFYAQAGARSEDDIVVMALPLERLRTAQET